MHFGHFGTSLRGGIIECARMDPRFLNYSPTSMRLCGLRSFSSPLLGIGPGAGLPTPTPSQGPQGWGSPGAAGVGWPPSYGGMVPQSLGAWEQIYPMGHGGFRGFGGGLFLSWETLTF
jgi:hypothetical protein